MDDERQKAIKDFIAKHPTLDALAHKLLTSKEADFLFKKQQQSSRDDDPPPKH